MLAKIREIPFVVGSIILILLTAISIDLEVWLNNFSAQDLQKLNFIAELEVLPNPAIEALNAFHVEGNSVQPIALDLFWSSRKNNQPA